MCFHEGNMLRAYTAWVDRDHMRSSKCNHFLKTLYRVGSRRQWWEILRVNFSSRILSPLSFSSQRWTEWKAHTTRRQTARVHTLISIRDDKSSELKDERWTATGKRPRAEVWRYRLIPVPPPLIDNVMGQDRWFCSNLKVTRKLDLNYNAQPHFIGSVRGIVIRISYKRDLSNWKLEFDMLGFAYDLCCRLTEPFDYYPSCG